MKGLQEADSFEAQGLLSNSHNDEKLPSFSGDNQSCRHCKPRRVLKGKWRILGVLYLVLWFALCYFIGARGVPFVVETVEDFYWNTYKLAGPRLWYDITTSVDEFMHPGSAEEVASLMSEFYELFAEMGYLNGSLIARPPYVNPGINKTLAKELDISDRAVQMMEMLPYVSEAEEYEDRMQWNYGGGEGLGNGQFVDYRNADDLELSRDPIYAAERDEEGNMKGYDVWGGKYMRPDYICLSFVNEESSIMVLNTKNYRIWTLDGWDNVDPKTKHLESWGEGNNWLALERRPSRPAKYVLREYIDRYRSLEAIPGGLDPGTYEGDAFVRLYRENGWPDNFNATSFAAARAQWDEEESERWDIEQPFNEIRIAERAISAAESEIVWAFSRMGEAEIGQEIAEQRKDYYNWLVGRNGKVEDIEGLPSLEIYKKQLELILKRSREELVYAKDRMAAAKQKIEEIGPEVKKAREERIAKYGY